MADIQASPVYTDLLTAKELQVGQLDEALKTLVRLRSELDGERKKATQAFNERHAIQTDLDKFRTMQREAAAAQVESAAAIKAQAKPWYKIW